MLAAALSQVLGALWAFVLDMVACLTGRCAHAPLKSELPIVAPPYEDRVSRQVHHKAAAVSTHAYGATSLAWRNNGFGAFFDDSGEELDVKEFGARIDDTEDMKSEWSKLLKQGSDSKTFEDDDLYFFSPLTTKKASPEPGQFHDAAFSLLQAERVLEDINLEDISCSSSPSTAEQSSTDSPLSTSPSYEAFEKFQMFRFPLGPASPDCASPIASPGPWFDEFDQTVTASGSEFSPAMPMTISIGKRGIVLHDYGDFGKDLSSAPGPFRRGYQWTRGDV